VSRNHKVITQRGKKKGNSKTAKTPAVVSFDHPVRVATGFGRYFFLWNASGNPIALIAAPGTKKILPNSVFAAVALVG